MGFSKLFFGVKVLRPSVGFKKAVRPLATSTEAPKCLEDKETTTQANPPQGGGKKCIVLGVYESERQLELTPNAEEVNQRSGGKLTRYLNELSCQLKLGKAFVVTDVLPEFGDVALASYGPKNAGYNKLEELDEYRENVRWGVGAGVSVLRKRGCGDIQVDSASVPDAAAEAATLAAWRFQEFKSEDDRDPTAAVAMLQGQKPTSSEDEKKGSEGQQWARGEIMGHAQNWARYLSDMPANKMTPTDIAEEALRVLCPLGVQVQVRDRTWAEVQRMEAFLAVAKGSCEQPLFLDCSYSASQGSKAPVLLAAKGVTFDCRHGHIVKLADLMPKALSPSLPLGSSETISGGLCLKRADEMRENRGSMAGAAVVLAALKATAELKVPINVRAVIPLCENLISGQCMKVGDVVRALNGTTIQIQDTDMEGRLMLADALVYGQAAYRPSLVVDVATFTRGVLLATGGGAFGCFSRGEAAWRALRAAGASAGDRPWRLPLWDYYRAQLVDDPSVDLKNKGSGTATPCLGAAFLKNFVCGEWLHLDVTGVGKLAHAVAPPYLRKRRMSGRPTRTLAYFLTQLADDDQPAKTPSKGCQAKS